jgi:hypothetical protein
LFIGTGFPVASNDGNPGKAMQEQQNPDTGDGFPFPSKGVDNQYDECPGKDKQRDCNNQCPDKGDEQREPGVGIPDTESQDDRSQVKETRAAADLLQPVQTGPQEYHSQKCDNRKSNHGYPPAS